MPKVLLFFLALHSLHLQDLAAASQGGPPPSPRETSLLTDSYLGDVSRSVLKAEAWLRAHVLSHYPASGTTAIIVGDTLSCTGEREPKLGLVLLSLKNIHHSLKRWGLEKDIKLSVSLSGACLTKDSVSNVASVRSVLKFLESVNSTYILDSSSVKSSPLSEVTRKLGSLGLNRPWEGKTMGRKLRSSSFTFKPMKPPYLARQNLLPKIPPETAFHSFVGFSVPSHTTKSPHPPPSSSRLASPPPLPTLPPLTFPFAPEQPPVFVPAMAPFALTLPPCSPSADDGGAGTAPSSGTAEMGRQRLWCVAKPTVPEETLQKAMDFACGEGGDCGEIMPSGSCYYPNTVIAHASYALNSYWQKNKRSGGTCYFGGTAMLINADPSFLHCKFELS